jgi:hypothetical protein
LRANGLDQQAASRSADAALTIPAPAGNSKAGGHLPIKADA